MQLQCEASADARELLRLHAMNKMSEDDNRNSISDVSRLGPLQQQETSVRQPVGNEDSNQPGNTASNELIRQAAELVSQVKELMPHKKTDWVLSA